MVLSAEDGNYEGTESFKIQVQSLDTSKFVVRWNSSVAGMKEAPVHINDNDTPGNLQISEADTYSFGSITVGATNAQTFTITNTGGSDVTLSGVSLINSAFRFTGGSFPGVGGDCIVGTVSMGNNCSIEVEFAPGTIGSKAGSIQVDYNDGVNSQQSVRLISGDGLAVALLDISESNPYDYGVQTGIVSKTFTVDNIGGSPANITSVVSGLPAKFSITADNCTGVLAAGANCTIDINFNGSGTTAQSTNLTITYDNGASNGINYVHGLLGDQAAPIDALFGFLGADNNGTQSSGSNTCTTSVRYDVVLASPVTQDTVLEFNTTVSTGRNWIINDKWNMIAGATNTPLQVTLTTGQSEARANVQVTSNCSSSWSGNLTVSWVSGDPVNWTTTTSRPVGYGYAP